MFQIPAIVSQSMGHSGREIWRKVWKSVMQGQEEKIWEWTALTALSYKIRTDTQGPGHQKIADDLCDDPFSGRVRTEAK